MRTRLWGVLLAAIILSGCAGLQPPPQPSPLPSPTPLTLEQLVQLSQANVVRAFTCLSGSGTGCLGKFPVASLVDKDFALGAVDNVAYIYQYNAASTVAEDSPKYIRPADNASPNPGVWHRVTISAESYEGGRSSQPEITFWDLEAAVARANGKIYLNCTDTGDGTEDCDLYIQVHSNGVLTTKIQIDADGNIILNGNTLLTSNSGLQFGDSGTYINQSADGTLAVVADQTVQISAGTNTNIQAGDEDLSISKTGTNGITVGSNTGVTDVTFTPNVNTQGTLGGKLPTAVNSASGTVSVTQAQARANTMFLNTYAGTATFTLPGAEAGMAVCVKNGQGNSQILRFDTDGTDYLVKPDGARTSAAGDYYGCTASAQNQLCAVAYDTTDWYITVAVGTCAEE